MERVWFRDPNRIAAELGEVGHLFVTWSRTELNKSKTDPKAFGNLHWGTSSKWEGLVIGQGSAVHVDAEHGLDNPRAVYPVWEYGDDWGILEELGSNPIGMDSQVCTDPVIDTAWRPVLGQEHVVVICGLPSFATGVGKSIVRRLNEFQNDYPECTVFIDGSYSYNVLFGMSFRAGNIDTYRSAKAEEIQLPSGRSAKLHSFPAHAKWIHILGASIPELREQGKRVRFNVRSAIWAAENYSQDILFKSQGTQSPVDPTAVVHVPATMSHQNLPMAQPGDKINCDTCSLQMQCKYYRQGSVCTMPNTETKQLAKMFGTRDVDTIIDAVGKLVGRQADRVERGMAEEEVLGVLDPEIGKQLNSVIDNGIKLAKLVDPSLAGGPKVQVNVGQGAAGTQVQMVNTDQMVGQIVREIQQRTGLSASQITPEMITQQLSIMAGGSVVPGEIVQ